MKYYLLTFLLVIISGCATTSWTSKISVDEFTDKQSCKIVYGNDFGKSLNKGLGGIHYYPFIEKAGEEVIFGVHNDYNIPVGDVQIRIDKNEAIIISYTETPVFYSASYKVPDTSYMKDIEGIDQEVLQSTMKSSIENMQKIMSPFTATSGEKAQMIIKQMKSGSILKMRIIGHGTNSLQSTSGEYRLDEQLVTSLNACKI